jgi:hypothetical protein
MDMDICTKVNAALVMRQSPVIKEKTGGGFTGDGIPEEALRLAGGKGKKHRMLLNGLAAGFCFWAST